MLYNVIYISVNPLKVFGTISVYAISVFSIFAVTLTCFPSLTLLMNSVNGKDYKVWAEDYFIPVSFCVSTVPMYWRDLGKHKVPKNNNLSHNS